MPHCSGLRMSVQMLCRDTRDFFYHYEAPLRRLASWRWSSRFSARRSRFSIRKARRERSNVA
jgi:hypothetical protein